MMSDGEYSRLLQIIEYSKNKKIKQIEQEAEQYSSDELSSILDDHIDHNDHSSIRLSSNGCQSKISEDNILTLSKLLQFDNNMV
ncbi:hypothetical protein ACF0H5_004057 [Mactra antiquata]